MYKILVLKNRIDVDITDDCSKAVAYFAKHNINISFDFKEISEPVTTKQYSAATNGVVYSGIDDYVKDSCDKYVEKGKYHAVIFAWNTKDAPNNDPTSWTNWSPLTWAKADTEFIQLVTNDFNDKVDWIYKSICHEIMHTMCKRLGRKGLVVLDEMDLTVMPDGTKIPYYLNDQPDAVGGNFAQTFDNLSKYQDRLYEFYFISKEKPTYKYFKPSEIIGLKPELVGLLDKARGISGVPFSISSGLRTPEYNASVGGVEGSAHTLGKAVDIHCPSSVNRLKMVKALLGVGFKRIGVGKDFIHVDIGNSSDNLPEDVMWTYYK